ncbi:MAG: HD domain-containing protein [Clostridiales bacterium]|nr:HD domain-containing protein [Clostridiales bacterium]
MNRVMTNKKDFSQRILRILALFIVGVSINILLSEISSRLGLPLYLDAVGTVMTAFVGGSLPAIAVGYLTNIFRTFLQHDASSIYYGALNVMIAVVAAGFSRRELKKRYIVPLILILAVIGGCLGSLLTWFLFGFAGEGVSADLAIKIKGAVGNRLAAQLIADFLIDIVDKTITVLISATVFWLLPKSFIKIMHVYGWQQTPIETEELDDINRTKVRKISLRAKLLLLVSIAVTLVAVVAIGIGFIVDRQNTIDDHAAFANGIVNLGKQQIDPEMVDSYIEKGRAAEGYADTLKALEQICHSSDDIKYMYAYQFREDGVRVVFDVDTEDTIADRPGVVLAYDKSFEDLLPGVLLGQPVDPVITKDEYGWLLSVYEPLYNSAGKCVCYVAVDIEMNQIVSNTQIYLTKQISLFLGFFIMVLAFGLWLADYNIIYPLNAMSHGANAFAYTSTQERNESVERIKGLAIHTGDEIENLYNAYSQTTEESMQYMTDIRKKSKQIDKLQGGLLMVLADIIESRDKCTGDHIRKTAEYTKIILERLKEKGEFKDKLTDEYIANVFRAAPLHDIGKINVPDAVLNKPDRLTDEEFKIMQGHTTAGYEIILRAIENMEETGYLQQAKHMAHSHHEKWDGSGYPNHLAGEKIPLSARIMAVADVFDALVSRRSYKEPFSFEKAMSIIEEGAGKHFDPQIVAAFVESKDKVKAVMEKYAE